MDDFMFVTWMKGDYCLHWHCLPGTVSVTQALYCHNTVTITNMLVSTK